MNKQPDGTLMLLKRMGLPVTRENYLRVAFMGNPPEEPLDGEIEAELPEELQLITLIEAWHAELTAELAELGVMVGDSCGAAGRRSAGPSAADRKLGPL
jgi:hypothetical protein